MDCTTPRTRVAVVAGPDTAVPFPSFELGLLHPPKATIALPSSAKLFIVIVSHPWIGAKQDVRARMPCTVIRHLSPGNAEASSRSLRPHDHIPCRPPAMSCIRQPSGRRETM